MARKNDADVVKLWKQKKIQQSGCRKKTWWYWWDGVKVHMKSFVALKEDAQVSKKITINMVYFIHFPL